MNVQCKSKYIYVFYKQLTVIQQFHTEASNYHAKTTNPICPCVNFGLAYTCKGRGVEIFCSHLTYNQTLQ